VLDDHAGGLDAGSAYVVVRIEGSALPRMVRRGPVQEVREVMHLAAAEY
jgi:hypothetical protein